VNDLELTVDPEGFFELVSGVSTGEVAKAAVAALSNRHSRARDPSDS